MKLLLTFAFLLLPCLSFAAGAPGKDIQLPLTIKASTIAAPQQSASFNVPDNKTGNYRILFPCDPAWSLQIGIRFSVDNGNTWDCDMTKIGCTGFYRPVASCLDLAGNSMANFGVTWRTTKGALDPKTKMQVLFVSNLTKTVTVTITFDPDQ